MPRRAGRTVLTFNAFCSTGTPETTSPIAVDFYRSSLKPEDVGNLKIEIDRECDSLPCLDKVRAILDELIDTSLLTLPRPGPPPEKILPFQQFQVQVTEFVRRGMLPSGIGARFNSLAQGIIDAINTPAPAPIR